MTSEPLISQTIETRVPGVIRALDSSGLEARLVDPLQDPAWDRLAHSHPKSTAFHSAAWAEVLVKSYRHKPFYLHFLRRGKTVALLPFMEVCSTFTGRRGVCLPFSDFCDPLIFDEYESRIGMQKLAELARERNWKYFEVRSGETHGDGNEPASTFYGHELDLRGGLAEVTSRFASSVRRAIRKGEKSALVTRMDCSRAAVLEFYELHVRTRRRHGIPPQPLSFFLNIHESILKPGRGFLVLARRESKPVAAAVFFQWGKNALYKFGASDETLQEFRGNNIVIWEGIRFLVQQNAESLHFGRTSLDNNGLRQFKLSWGAEEKPIQYFRFETVTGGRFSERSGRGAGFHKRIFSRLPLALNRLAGSMVYPHLD